jgi:hypothetical protein
VTSLLQKIQETYPGAFFWRPLRKGRQGRKPALFEVQLTSTLVEKRLSDQQETLPTVEALVDPSAQAVHMDCSLGGDIGSGKLPKRKERPVSISYANLL